jgi:hypothetical protein
MEIGICLPQTETTACTLPPPPALGAITSPNVSQAELPVELAADSGDQGRGLFGTGRMHDGYAECDRDAHQRSSQCGPRHARHVTRPGEPLQQQQWAHVSPTHGAHLGKEPAIDQRAGEVFRGLALDPNARSERIVSTRENGVDELDVRLTREKLGNACRTLSMVDEDPHRCSPGILASK